MTIDTYGLDRVVRPAGVLPQRAEVLDPSLPVREGELLIDVEQLNIDAASFRQIEKQENGDIEGIKAHIREIVGTRGKMHNPVTGSGGMLLGRVREIRKGHPAEGHLQVGDRIATLVSLTLTPLKLERIDAVHKEIERVDVKGHAILFASGLYAKLPADLDESLALAALDVCGAPALTKRLVKPGMRVLVLGAGKSGALCCAQAKANGARQVLALDISEPALERLKNADLVDGTLVGDATRPAKVLAAVTEATDGELCDFVINCASVQETELASILSCRRHGGVLFFSMATNFTAAALGTEGVGKDVTLYIGNGYAEGHAELTLELLRTHRGLRKLFEEKYSRR
ncbi:MAG: L-erythro-3,5-diaminohexanoate dehydrogenase [Myxococcales bacterium]|jgi:L-erythro-3,5-diaminohexanoate dehydrogenase